MNEQDWLTCSDPQKMLEFLGDKPERHRKFRLFSALCCQQVNPYLATQKELDALPIVEGFADGLTKDGELYDAGHRILYATLEGRIQSINDESAQCHARRCINLACEEYEYFAASIQVAQGTSAATNAALVAAHVIPSLEA